MEVLESVRAAEAVLVVNVIERDVRQRRPEVPVKEVRLCCSERSSELPFDRGRDKVNSPSDLRTSSLASQDCSVSGVLGPCLGHDTKDSLVALIYAAPLPETETFRDWR